MREEYQEIGKIGHEALLNVTTKGTGLCLYLPKDIVDVHGIMASDRIEVKLERHYRQKRFTKGGGE